MTNEKNTQEFVNLCNISSKIVLGLIFVLTVIVALTTQYDRTIYSAFILCYSVAILILLQNNKNKDIENIVEKGRNAILIGFIIIYFIASLISFTSHQFGDEIFCLQITSYVVVSIFYALKKLKSHS